MHIILALLVLSTIADGLFGGIALQKLLVELPARKKIGAVAFGAYARASDLGNGRIVYPAFAIGGFLIKGLLLLLAWHGNAPVALLAPLTFAMAFSVGILVMTSFAAPQMLRVRAAADTEQALAPLLEKFVTYSVPRAVCIWAQFAVILWALVIAVSRWSVAR